MKSSTGVNTGKKIYQWLIEVDVNTGLPTGNKKPNNPDDPDYITPVVDYVKCPIKPIEENGWAINLLWSGLRGDNAKDRFIMPEDEDQFRIEYELNENFNFDEDAQISIFISLNEGASWMPFVEALNNTYFDDSVGSQNRKWYRASITHQDETYFSNVLKITKLTYGVGDLKLVYNSQEYAPFSHIDIDSNDLDEYTFLIKNRSTLQLVELADVDFINHSSNVSCVIIEDGTNNLLENNKYLIRPQLGEIININGAWRALKIKEVPHEIGQQVRIAVKSMDPTYPTAIYWWTFKIRTI